MQWFILSPHPPYQEDLLSGAFNLAFYFLHLASRTALPFGSPPTFLDAFSQSLLSIPLYSSKVMVTQSSILGPLVTSIDTHYLKDLIQIYGVKLPNLYLQSRYLSWNAAIIYLTSYSIVPLRCPKGIFKLTLSKPNTQFPFPRLAFPISVSGNTILCSIQVKIIGVLLDSSLTRPPFNWSAKPIGSVFKKNWFLTAWSKTYHLSPALVNWCSSLHLCPATVYYSQVVRVILFTCTSDVTPLLKISHFTQRSKAAHFHGLMWPYNAF